MTALDPDTGLDPDIVATYGARTPDTRYGSARVRGALVAFLRRQAVRHRWEATRADEGAAEAVREAVERRHLEDVIADWRRRNP